MKNQNSDWLIGTHAVHAALTAGRREIHELWIGERHEGKLPKLPNGLKAQKRDSKFFDSQFKGRPHQHIAAKVGPLPQLQLEDLLEANGLILLDQISDPHNLGAIIRSAAAFGIGGIVLPAHNSVSVTETVAKAASGALEIVPVVTTANLNRAIEKLKKNNFWLVGLDGEAEQTLQEIDLKTGKFAFVMGSEGDGMRRLVQENCDFLAKLPISQNMESLNVSVATAITLYEWNRQKA